MKKLLIDRKNIDAGVIKDAADMILGGAIAAIPTETVYGLAVNLENKESLVRLYEVKQRSKDMPISIALADKNKAISEYFTVLPPFGYRLIEQFWPGPLTIVYFNKDDEKIGIRVPSDEIARGVLSRFKSGIYLTSANLSGSKEAMSALEVENIFDGNIDLIVDAGDTLYRKASTVVDLTLHPFKILREGVVPEKDIIDTFIRKRIVFVCAGNSCRSPMAQVLLEKYLNEVKPYLAGRHEIISRGVSTSKGLPASAYTVDVLKQKEGIDITGFASQMLDRETILSSDLIFTMEDGQTDNILNFEPTAEGRIFGLKKFLPSELEKDIPDPIGKGMPDYENVYALIKKAIVELVDWL
ncbi:MAG: L-threonylcarbamoyladenylate synthase [Candidatus Omnitrophota bacterium]